MGSLVRRTTRCPVSGSIQDLGGSAPCARNASDITIATRPIREDIVFPSPCKLNPMIDPGHARGQATAQLLRLNDLHFAQVQLADGFLDLGAIANNHPNEMIGINESTGSVLQIANR